MPRRLCVFLTRSWSDLQVIAGRNFPYSKLTLLGSARRVCGRRRAGRGLVLAAAHNPVGLTPARVVPARSAGAKQSFEGVEYTIQKLEKTRRVMSVFSAVPALSCL